MTSFLRDMPEIERRERSASVQAFPAEGRLMQREIPGVGMTTEHKKDATESRTR
jgi:hypothetical protein